MSRLWSSETCTVEFVPADRTLIICNADGVTLIHTECGGVINAFSHDAKVTLPWMQTCKCRVQHAQVTYGAASTTPMVAPNTGGDTSPLPSPEPEVREATTFQFDGSPEVLASLSPYLRPVNRKDHA